MRESMMGQGVLRGFFLYVWVSILYFFGAAYRRIEGNVWSKKEMKTNPTCYCITLDDRNPSLRKDD